MASCLVKNTSTLKNSMLFQEWGKVLFRRIDLHQQRSSKELSKIKTLRKLKILKLWQWVAFIQQISQTHGMRSMPWVQVRRHSIVKNQWTSSNRKAWKKQPQSHLICGRAHRTSSVMLKTWAVAKKIWRMRMIWSVKFLPQILIGVKGKKSWKLLLKERKIGKSLNWIRLSSS